MGDTRELVQNASELGPREDAGPGGLTTEEQHMTCGRKVQVLACGAEVKNRWGQCGSGCPALIDT